MNKELKQWLNSPTEYSEGVKLYSKFGSSSSLKRLFERSDETDERRANLIYELWKIFEDTMTAPKLTPPIEKRSTRMPAAQNAAFMVQAVDEIALPIPDESEETNSVCVVRITLEACV